MRTSRQFEKPCESGKMLMEERGENIWPLEDRRSLVKIPLEEVESFYRFTVSCDELNCKFLDANESVFCVVCK